VSAFDRAVEIQDGLPYMEPPYWYYPVRQSLGAALLAAGQPQQAEAVFWQSLLDYPNNGWALYGLAQAHRAQGEDRAAAYTDRLLQRAWAGDEAILDLARL
jgi:tetratricopeptide (TPR) repeat protein